MKEITILSGKGGTGKTSIAAALASIAQNAVFCDNDVDAADMHLLLQPEIKEEHIFYSTWKAKIDQGKCNNCGLCKEKCRFDSIKRNEEGQLYINPFQCEGCRLCERICPIHAITSEQNSNNFWYISDTRFGKLVHAWMGPGEENSGKLVTQIRKTAKQIAEKTNAEFLINDGPPGIGCAAIASISGTGAVLLVTEPTKSGLHDAKRLVELVKSFNIPIYGIINKYDINETVSEEIVYYFNSQKIQVLGKLPFDTKVVEAIIEGKTIIEYDQGGTLTLMIKEIWEKLKFVSI